MESLKVALVGAGKWGKNILRVLNELKVLSIVVEIDSNKIAELSKKYPHVKFSTKPSHALRPDIAAAVIATPSHTHYELAKLFIESKKHVFVEKPLALKLSEAEDLIALAQRNNSILMVGHILHFHPAVRKLKQLIDSGEIGDIKYIYSNRLNLGRIRNTENVIWSFAPHDISLILSLTKEEPKKVKTHAGDYINAGIHDIAVLTMEFSRNVKAHIFVSWLNPYKEHRLVVIGSKAMIVFDDTSEDKLKLYPYKIESPTSVTQNCIKLDVEKAEPLKEELKHFIECIKTNSEPLTSGRKELNVIKVLERIQAQLNSGSKFFVHESSYIDPGVEIGEGTKIWHFSHILKGTKIGKNCVIGQNVMIGPDVEIGNGCKIQNNVSIYKGVKLEDEVFVGPSAVFTNVKNPRAFIERKHAFKPTMVKKGATIGANATILCGVTLGEYCFIGAGAVVTKDVKPHALMLGVPAKQAGWVCRCGGILKKEKGFLICPICRQRYSETNGNLKPVS